MNGRPIISRQENAGQVLTIQWTSPEHQIEEVEEKERCSGSYCQAVGFLVIKDDSISERPG